MCITQICRPMSPVESRRHSDNVRPHVRLGPLCELDRDVCPEVREVPQTDDTQCSKTAPLFDHLVGAGGRERRRYVEAEGFGRLEIDHQLEFCSAEQSADEAGRHRAAGRAACGETLPRQLVARVAGMLGRIWVTSRPYAGARSMPGEACRPPADGRLSYRNSASSPPAGAHAERRPRGGTYEAHVDHHRRRRRAPRVSSGTSRCSAWRRRLLPTTNSGRSSTRMERYCSVSTRGVPTGICR